MFDAYPYEHFGFIEGAVTEIANVPTAPEDVPIATDVPEALFRVSVELDSQHMSAYGKRWPIQPGGMVSADMILESRTFLEWLYEPVRAVQRSLS